MRLLMQLLINPKVFAKTSKFLRIKCQRILKHVLMIPGDWIAKLFKKCVNLTEFNFKVLINRS